MDKAQKSAGSNHSGASFAAAPSSAPGPEIPAELAGAVLTTDLQGVVTGCSRGLERYGYAPAQIVGLNLADLFSADDRFALTQEVLPAVREKGRDERKLYGKAKSGGEFGVHLCLTLVRDADSAPMGMVAMASELAEHDSNEPQPGRKRALAAVAMTRRVIEGTEFLIASPIMHKFMGMVDRVAEHTETVLITGETGTGKEMVARTIHGSSHRSHHALVDINCAALPEHLVESELFGYEKGAFSGADSSKPGLFELADKSTIFLDEIGELQPQIQVKLLRVLDGQPYYRLGGNRKINVDVRVVAATNQDLEVAVKEGRFRKDLFHRLGQFHLCVPALRERPEDIAALARHFLSLKGPEKVFAGDALAALRAYCWPGNIRELRNLVAKLAMGNDSRQITSSEAQAELQVESERGPTRASAAVPLGNLDNMKEQMIIRALEQTGGHRAQAAEQLGISRRTLSRKLREYAINTRGGDGAAKLGTISEDQQKFFRAKVNLPITLRNAQGKELHAQAVNLSTGGMGLDEVSDATGFAGLLDVSFLLPDSETVMQAKGRLVWADAGGRAGLRFVVIEPALFVQLQHWTNRKMKDEGWELPS